MVISINRRLLCCLCSASLDEVPATDYVQLTATFPEVDETMVQHWGAHRDCLQAKLANGFTIEGPL